jgi:hypothetical protein
MIPLVFGTLFRQTSDISANSYYVLDTFGFAANGTFQVNITQYAINPSLCFALLTNSEWSTVPDTATPCQMKLGIHRPFGSVPTAKLQGYVPSAGIYLPVFAVPSGHFSLTETSIFRNPKTYLDSRWGVVVPFKIVFLICYTVCFIYWFVNWYLHFSTQIRIHYLLTSVVVAMLLYSVVRAIEISLLNQADTAAGWFLARLTVQVLAEVLFYFTLLMLAKGWCIVRDSLPVSQVVLAMFYSAFFIGFQISVEYTTHMTLVIVFLAFALLFVCFFVRDLVVSLNHATLRVIAHMVAIANRGINPRTTPIWQKYVMFRSFQRIVIVGAVLIMAYYICSVFLAVPFGADEIITDSLQLAVIVAWLVLFRLRGSTRRDYYRVRIEGTGDPGQVLRTDLDDVDLGSEALSVGREWKEGMALPSQPKVVKPENVDPAARIVLATPDGTAAVPATSAAIE